MARSTTALFLILGAVLQLPVQCQETTSPRRKFKAAVYQHALIPPPKTETIPSRQEALEFMKKNLDVYKMQAKAAKEQMVDILVFPEDGIYGFIFPTRASIYPFLEFIPNASDTPWSPCTDPDRYPDTEVQHALSCMAKDNSLYLVANMGDKQPCTLEEDPNCPEDGRYQYNTAVAFGPDGTILAKYHKSHLFYEDQFDEAEPEVVSFDTPFGTFGLMICFDVLFEKPAVPLVLENKIANIIFTTAWMDALPLLSAIGYHSSFARGMGVNFLSANLHIPDMRFHGSGLYGPDGMEGFYYGATNTSDPKLIIAELDVLSKPRPNIDVPSSFKTNIVGPSVSQQNKDNSDGEISVTQPPKDKGTSGISKSDEFYSDLFFDKFTFRTLDKPSGEIRVCQNDICCDLEYAMDDNMFGHELFAFGAFDGLHTYEGTYYFQICTLVKCADPKNRTTCGSVTDTTSTPFQAIQMGAQLQTHFIYPQIVLSDPEGNLGLAKAESWGFSNASLWTHPSLDQPLLSAALYGRVYRRDRDNVGDSQGQQDNGDTKPGLYTFYATLVITSLFTTAMTFLFG